MTAVEEFLESFGEKTPERLKTQYKKILTDINA